MRKITRAVAVLAVAGLAIVVPATNGAQSRTWTAPTSAVSRTWT